MTTSRHRFSLATSSLATSAPEDNLRRLLLVRGLFLLVVCATLGWCYSYLALPLAYLPMLWVVSGLTLISVATLLQLRFFSTASPWVFFSQLLIDIVGVTLLLFFAGGADNPFVSYYLVPLCIAAATLPRWLSWPLVLAALVSYTALIFWHVPLPAIAPQHSEHSGHAGAGLSAHSLGMWLNFLVSALLITYFVVAMAASLRRQDADLARLREDRLRDEQLMAMATLAAGTAHELGTPLTTIKTLVHELQLDPQLPDPVQEDLALLQNQVAHCTDTLKQLNRRAQELKDGILPLQTVREQCRKILNDWLLLRPEVTAHIDIDAQAPNLQLRWQPTIAQSISNLLNNAADANPEAIEINVHWDHRQLQWHIRDHGPGVDPVLARELGQPFVTQKGEGRGLGLFLTRAAIARYDGQLQLANHPQGGMQVTLTLPLIDARPTAGPTAETASPDNERT